ncbi:VOC family protein [Methanoplanus limicola]|uniref:Glyoxalase/bleomycin resistance protein/dioxygenase n=1 Tax=Methanoplanus limicola DSM 2279 TaxID=937775 RepID=H1YZG6_9EURY|nr:VOC family protein [Methanoplanus limicola]EHQ36075.1 Glyoxalase/bleomycin resistance protein/dioxygenase [Methanoplanus limicola DSM 2279]
MDSKRLFSYSSTVLFVKDVEVSKKFYTGIMGEEIELDLGLNVGFKGGLAIWDGYYAEGVVFGTDNSGVDVAGSGGDAAPGDGGESGSGEDGSAKKPFSSERTLELYYETDDMTGSFEKLKDAGVEFVHEVIEQPWKQLTVRFLDPDGHIIEVGERMDVCVKRLFREGKSAEKIAEETTMPAEIVKFMLDN